MSVLWGELDEDVHVSVVVQYIESNVLVDSNDNVREVGTIPAAARKLACKCDDGACAETDRCACRQIVSNDDSIEQPLMECSDYLCPCTPSTCTNRPTRQGPLPGLRIFCTHDGRGLGVITTTGVSAGTFVCEYVGELIDAYETKQRWLFNRSRGYSNYILRVKEHGRKVFLTTVDASRYGNVGRFMNHACDPNLIIKLIRTDAMTPRICLFTSRDVAASEELTFHYHGAAPHGTNEYVTEVKETEARIPCLCGASNCSKWLPWDEMLC